MNELFKHKAFWWTIIAIVVLIALILFIRWMIRIAPKKGLTDEIKIDKNDLSYPGSQYVIWADMAHTAMEGKGANKNTIMGIITQLQTRADWDQLVKSYGVRKLTMMFGWITTSNGTLPSNLREEFKNSTIEEFNKHLRAFGVSI